MDIAPRYKYAVVDITNKCNLRCKHCYYYGDDQNKPEKDLGDDEFIEGLTRLRDKHAIKSVSWVGGEPMLRPRLLERGLKLFPMNVVFTNGMLPIPPLPCPVGISLDGPKEINDSLRGKGSYDTALKHARERNFSVFCQLTIHKLNEKYITELIEELHKVGILGVMTSFHVPQKGEGGPLAWSSVPERDSAVETALKLKERFGSFLLLETEVLELMLSGTAEEVTKDCDMLDNAIALDNRLNRKFCCYGDHVDCTRCGAPTPFIRRVAMQKRDAK